MRKLSGELIKYVLNYIERTAWGNTYVCGGGEYVLRVINPELQNRKSKNTKTDKLRNSSTNINIYKAGENCRISL